MSIVGVVGLGAMGSRIAERLLRAGHDVTVWNRTRARAEPLANAGAKIAANPAELARDVDAVIAMLADPQALRDVTEGSEGVLAGARPGSAIIQMSTVAPEDMKRLASLLPSGVDLLDAPVLGSISEVEQGALAIFLGGPHALVKRWEPVLSALGAPVVCGSIGDATAAKLVANSTLFGILGVLGEALALAERLGLPRDVMFDVLSRTPLAAQAGRRRAALESGEYPLRFTMALACKDADLILGAARQAGTEMRLVEAMRSWLTDATHAGHASGDYSAVLAYIRDQS